MRSSVLGGILRNVLKISIFLVAGGFAGCEKAATSVSGTAPDVKTVPGTPTIGTITIGDGTALVNFSPPVSDGGSVISLYTITSSPDNIVTTGTTSPIYVTGLQNGKSYAFTIKATNAIGTSSPSVPTTPVTPTSSTIQALHANGSGWKLTKWEEQAHPGDPWNTFVLSTCDKDSRIYFETNLTSRTVISDRCSFSTPFPNVQTWALGSNNTKFLFNGLTCTIELLSGTTFQITFYRDAVTSGAAYKYLTRLTYTLEKVPASPSLADSIPDQALIHLINGGRGWKWIKNECQYPAGTAFLDFPLDKCQTSEISYYDIDRTYRVAAPAGCTAPVLTGLNAYWTINSQGTEIYLGGHPNTIEVLDTTTLQISNYYENFDGYQNLSRFTYMAQ